MLRKPRHGVRDSYRTCLPRRCIDIVDTVLAAPACLSALPCAHVEQTAVGEAMPLALGRGVSVVPGAVSGGVRAGGCEMRDGGSRLSRWGMT